MVLVVLMQALLPVSVTARLGVAEVLAPTTPREKLELFALGLYVPVRVPLGEESAAVVPLVSSSFQYRYGV